MLCSDEKGCNAFKLVASMGIGHNRHNARKVRISGRLPISL